MVVLALERFCSIIWPLKENIFSTRKHAKQTLLILTSIILLWSTVKFLTPGVEIFSTFEERFRPDRVGLNQMCKRSNIIVEIVNLSTIFWAILPELFTFVLNLLIIKKIKLSTSKQGQFYPTERTKKITQATRVVLILSIIFIVLNSPTGILIIIDLIISNKKSTAQLSNQQIKQQLMFIAARKFVLMIYEANFIMSFPIYFYTIKNFK